MEMTEQVTTEVRGAAPGDYAAIRETIDDAFKNTYDESQVWDILIRHDAMFTPECARIAAVDGTAVATAVVLPRLVRTRDHWVKGAEITLVGCRSSFQGRGYGSMVTKDRRYVKTGSPIRGAIAKLSTGRYYPQIREWWGLVWGVLNDAGIPPERGENDPPVLYNIEGHWLLPLRGVTDTQLAVYIYRMPSGNYEIVNYLS